MSNAIITGVIAVVASVGAVVGLEAGGVLKNTSGQTVTEASVSASDMDTLRDDIKNLRADLRASNESRLAQDRACTELRKELRELRDDFNAAENAAPRVDTPSPLPSPNTTPETGLAPPPPVASVARGDVERLVKEELERREREERAQRDEREAKQREEFLNRMQERLIEQVGEATGKVRESAALTDAQMQDISNVSRDWYNNRRTYMATVEQRRKDGQEVPEEETRAELQRYDDARQASLKNVLSEQQFSQVSPALDEVYRDYRGRRGFNGSRRGERGPDGRGGDSRRRGNGGSDQNG